MSQMPLDISGQRFGKLVAIKRAYYKKNQGYLWLCKCDCGGECLVPAARLRNGNTRSCGCLKPKRTPIDKKLCGIWHGMVQRCYNRNDKAYKDYGARGIAISPEWLDVDTFIKDMASSYQPGLSVERIDNNKGYGKDNCKWADQYEQANNTRRNIKIAYSGETLTEQQWARRCGITRQTLHARLARGWSLKDAMSIPANYSNSVICKC